jgi:PST family polysaccharide transporter
MAVGHAASQGLWLVSLLVLAALLEPKDFGSLATGLTLVNLAGLLVDSGTRGSIIAAPVLGRGDVRRAVVLTTATGLAATAAIAALAGPIVGNVADGGDPGIVRALSIGVVLYAIGIAPLALLQKRLEFRRFAAVNIAAATVSSLIAVGAAVGGLGAWSLVVRQLASMGLLTVFAWIAARDLLPAGSSDPARLRTSLRTAGWLGFLGLAVTDFVALNADYVIVGHHSAAVGLGLYSLAFTLAFAPLTQVSWQLGRVLFPAAAATSDLATVARRTLVSLRLLALALMPAAVAAIAIAPPVLPALLGDKWRPMVVPFQILLAVGVGHGLLGMIGESLSGTGGIGLRARINAVWAAGMVAALLVLVNVDGIRGAALAHAALFIPFAAAYVVLGGRRLGITPPALAQAVVPVALPVAAQVLVTVGLLEGLHGAGASDGLSAAVAAVAGLAVAGWLLGLRPGSPLREARTLVADARAGDAEA